MLSTRVQAAIRLLQRSINMGTGLANSFDCGKAKELLWRLRQAGEALEPEEISLAALDLGWTPEAAGDLRSIARAIQRRKQPLDLSRPYWNDGILNRLDRGDG